MAGESEVYVCGNINLDATGLKTGQQIQQIPSRIPELAGASAVFSGPTAGHFFVLKQDTVFAFGKNDSGQLGLGHTDHTPAPTPLTSVPGTVKQVACGKRHSLFLMEDGAVYGCGHNEYGQTGGAKSGPIQTTLLLVEGLARKAVQVSAGIDSSYVLCEGGVLMTFGYPANGRLGLGTDGSYNKAASSIKMAFEPQITPEAVPGGPFAMVCAGATHALAVTEEGVVMSFGEGSYGRLGNGHHSNNDQLVPSPVDTKNMARVAAKPSMIAAGKTFNVCAMTGGSVFCWGRLRPTSEVVNKPQYDPGYCGGGKLSQIAMTDHGVVFVAGEAACAVGTGAAKQLGISATKASSSTPTYCETLDEVNVTGLAASSEAVLFLVVPDDIGKKALSKLPTMAPEDWPEVRAEAAPAEEVPVVKGKRKSDGAAKGRGRGRGAKRGKK